MQTTTSQNSFDQIIQKYREESYSERNKGDRFEKLMKAYLLTKPVYKNLLSDVWLWSEFPYKEQFGTGGKDTGIDIVCRTYEGEYWAVQCKCYRPEARIDLPHVSTFITTSAFPFSTKDGEKTFTHRIWIDTTYDGLNAEAKNALSKINATRIGLIDLRNDDVNWEELDAGKKGDEVSLVKYNLRPHQQEAFDSTISYFKTHDRGKVIMACGTGKTFTSLRIAEAMANDSHLVLFLVPSIALLSQTLKEWSAQAAQNIYPICICSDAKATKKVEDEISDLVLPATTDPDKVYRQFINFRGRRKSEGGMIVVFSTYQSIDVISEVQAKINKREKDSFIFDLIICDEAHRTTGIKQQNKIQSPFTKVHDNEFIRAKKRMYMTATPRLYSSDAQAKAKEKDILVWSMDDAEWYGEEIYRIGFGAAVEKQLLSDYKVIVLTLDENSVDEELKRKILNEHSEISADDATKLIGCINVLSKRTSYLTDKELFKDVDPEPMKSAVSFCANIENSKYITQAFNVCQQAYYETMSEEQRAEIVSVKADHVDGTMGSTSREEKLYWLKNSDPSKKECRVLDNVRCLSEGVDVPSLDAILFLSSRNSQVDVVQSVGRVMRRAEGKRFGYIIIPVVVPASANADEILDTSKEFKIVWDVLTALRAHDDRFNATINKIELNKKKPKIITVTGGGNFGGATIIGNDTQGNEDEDYTQGVLEFDELQQKLFDKFNEITNQVFAKIVTKCGSRRYWADWGKDIGEIAKRNIERINKLIATDGDHKQKFNSYWEGLKKNLNPSVSKEEAVEMLAQHMITKPVFEALFGNDHFTKENPVSKSLEEIVNLLDEKSDPEDLKKLDNFYKSVQQRAEGIDNAEGKQKVVVELYDSFFRNAFPLTVEKLGIVYTPVPVVDFILHSAEYVLNKEFGRSISDEKVNVIDPFTGTGTFITRLLQSGIIKPEDLERKYKHEIFANEIVLLAYYIASVNIENAYHDLLTAVIEPVETTNGKDVVSTSSTTADVYEPFNGICLTDTFQLYENSEQKLDDKVFSENSERVNEQKKQPITVIVGNPPYSIGQKSANDNAQNQNYPILENTISNTYVKLSSANLNKSTYDSYIKAFRWASDRLDKNGGIIAFITNSGWLDKNGLDGFRKSLQNEFDTIYVFNLRGAIRGKSGEMAKKEGQNIFDIMTGVAITILVKKNQSTKNCKIHYSDIGNYLSRKEKFGIITKIGSIKNLDKKEIIPNIHGDWLSSRNDVFTNWIPIESTKKFLASSESWFSTYAIGVATNRDAWVYNYSKNILSNNINTMVEYYNQQKNLYIKVQKDSQNKDKSNIDSIIKSDTSKISWTRGLKKRLEKNTTIVINDTDYVLATYRPFCKQNLCLSDDIIEMPGISKKLFPTSKHRNLIICIPGVGSNKTFSPQILDTIRDVDTYGGVQCFPLYWYETIESNQGTLFEEENQIIRHEAITDFILERAQSKYGNKVQREDIFYYVYGILHSKSYRETFEADLKKMLPRIPLVSDYQKFWAFSKAGRQLAELHLNYETVDAYPDVKIESLDYVEYADETPKQVRGDGELLMVAEFTGGPSRASGTTKGSSTTTGSTSTRDYNYYAVEQMKFPKKDQKDTIIYNHWHKITNIPAKAYEYVVNGKSAIEWIMERYAITTDKKSGITNNPNDWSLEHEKPRYIFDLLLSIINVSVQTVDIVNNLPEVDWEKE